MRFLAVEVRVDYRPGGRDGLTALEFSFDGNDDGDHGAAELGGSGCERTPRPNLLS
jgi:hypothetical protein